MHWCHFQGGAWLSSACTSKHWPSGSWLGKGFNLEGWIYCFFYNSLSLCAFDGALKSKYWLPLSLWLSLCLPLSVSSPCHCLSVTLCLCLSLSVCHSQSGAVVAVQFKMVSMHSEKLVCTPPHLSEVSPVSPLKLFQCLSDWWWPSLILSRKII